MHRCVSSLFPFLSLIIIMSLSRVQPPGPPPPPIDVVHSPIVYSPVGPLSMYVGVHALIFLRDLAPRPPAKGTHLRASHLCYVLSRMLICVVVL
jgi:hypothetical protein